MAHEGQASESRRCLGDQLDHVTNLSRHNSRRQAVPNTSDSLPELATLHLQMETVSLSLDGREHPKITKTMSDSVITTGLDKPEEKYSRKQCS